MREEFISIPKDVWESERKMRFFGAGTKEIYNKNYNIFIGVSISNKKITPNMALNYLKWALRNTKEKVAVVIADKLNIVNYEILDKYNKNKSKKRAERVGDEFEKMFRRAMEKLSAKDKENILIYRWDKVESGERYNKLKNFLEEQFKKDDEFSSAVLYFVRKYMRKKGRIIEDKAKVDKLVSYILGELPTLIQGIYLDGTHYDLCIYPTYFASGMSQFVMDMHKEELSIGKELKKLIRKKAVLVEAWLD
jgi:tRNA-dependent cyclodipeptide synthase